MFSVYLLFALGLVRVPYVSTEDPTLFLCDHLIEGSVCSTVGMAIYLASGENPTRPSTFYPVSHTQWKFTGTSNLKYLGVTAWDQENVSGKFSGVFYAALSGTYVFQLTIKHTINSNVCKFSTVYSPAIISVDLDYTLAGQAYDHACYAILNTKCNNYQLYTDSMYCERAYVLERGQGYPLFAGTRYNSTLNVEDELWMKLIYQSPSGASARIGKEAVLGLKGYSLTATPKATRSPTASATPGGTSSSTSLPEATASPTQTPGGGSSVTIIGVKKNSSGFLIGGMSIGVVFVVVAIALTVWVYLRRRKGNRRVGRSKSGGGVRKTPGSMQGKVCARRVSGAGVRRRASKEGLSTGGSESGLRSESSRRTESSRRSGSGSGHHRKGSGSGRRSGSGSGHHRKGSGSGRRSGSGSGSRRKGSGSGSGRRRKGSGSGSGSRRKGSVKDLHSVGGASSNRAPILMGSDASARVRSNSISKRGGFTSTHHGGSFTSSQGKGSLSSSQGKGSFTSSMDKAGAAYLN